MTGFQAGGVAPQDSQDEETAIRVEETKQPSVIESRLLGTVRLVPLLLLWLCLLAIWNLECKVRQKSKLESSLYRNMNSSSAEQHSVEVESTIAAGPF